MYLVTFKTLIFFQTHRTQQSALKLFLVNKPSPVEVFSSSADVRWVPVGGALFSVFPATVAAQTRLLLFIQTRVPAASCCWCRTEAGCRIGVLNVNQIHCVRDVMSDGAARDSTSKSCVSALKALRVVWTHLFCIMHQRCSFNQLLMCLDVSHSSHRLMFRKKSESISTRSNCSVCRPVRLWTSRLFSRLNKTQKNEKRISSLSKKCCKITESGNTFQTRDT